MWTPIKKRIEIEEIMCCDHKWLNCKKCYRFKVSFLGRLKFLFKGYKAEFEIPDEVLLDSKSNWERIGRTTRL